MYCIHYYQCALEAVGTQTQPKWKIQEYDSPIHFLIPDIISHRLDVCLIMPEFCLQCTSQEFFQIWASFLHDCKYYWRLAHRKLAKDRFEHDFRYKGQLVSVQLIMAAMFI